MPIDWLNYSHWRNQDINQQKMGNPKAFKTIPRKEAVSSRL
jgi:hypothetical protein